MNELETYLDRINHLAAQLSPQQSERLLQKIGRKIRQNNKKRIAANIDPSNAPFAARQGTVSRPSRRLQKEQTFLYRGQIHRYRTIKDYGEHYIGWDYQTQRTIKALKDQIRLPENGVRRQKMFRKIHRYQYLKLKVSSHEAAIGFLGRLGQIAAAHQYGEDNRPVRELLGFADEDLALIEAMLNQHFQAV